MIETIYPEEIQCQLDMLDKKILEITNKLSKESMMARTFEETQRIKRNLYELTRPYVDEKCRIIQNTIPKYKVTLDKHE